MRSLRLVVLSSFLILSACDTSNDDNTDLGEVPTQLVGSWVATSLNISGTDLVAGGTTFSITFGADNRYSFSTANAPMDLFCDGATSCSDSGVFAVQGQTFTFDADEPDPQDRTVLTIETLTDTTLVLRGSIDGEQVTFTFSRT